VQPRSPLPFDLRSKPQAFMQALAHDLDTPKAVQILSSFAEEILRAVRAGQAVQAAQKTLRSMGRIFGLRLDDEAPESAVLAGWNRHLQRTLTNASDA
jgi:cysteinyl-tRNA synthetase